MPLNGWNREYCNVKLGGITCDPDDTYYKNSKNNILHLPVMDDKNDLYIGVFGVGAYQEIISGVGGVHHCLLPEGNELIIHKKNSKTFFHKITNKQTPKEVLDILSYHYTHKLDRYINKK